MTASTSGMSFSDDSTNLKGLSFSDPRTAQRARDAIRQIATNQVGILGTNPNVGRVMSVDIAKLTASVWFPGDDRPVQVGIFPGAIPLDLGDYRGVSTYETSAVGAGGLVYVETFRGRPFITRILSGGEYQLNANVAGLTHRTFNANYQGTISGPPVADIYERHVNVKVDSIGGFLVGSSLMVGPWSGVNDGTSVDGIVEMTLSSWVTGQLKNQVRKYQFSVSDRMIVDLEGDEGNKPFWMRVLPETNLGTNPHAELAIDVGLVKTGIRTTLEFWIRLVPLDTWADQSVYFMSVKTYGSAFNVGDPRTGRLVLIKETVAAPVQGFLGFHNAGMGWTERDEYATFPQGTYFVGDEWSSGAWRSGPLRAAMDLRWLWSTTGQWFWGTDNKLLWEGNIVFKGIGPNWNALHTGSISVPFPTGNVPVFPADPNTFSTQHRSISGGILLNEGDTLYYGLCPGSGTGGQGSWHALQNLFFIVDSKTYNATQYNFSLPEWAIPIATRPMTNNGERREIIICNPAVDRDLDDRTRYIEVGYNTSHSGIVGSDETETMDVPSFRYRKKTAYRVTLKTGTGASVNTGVVLWRLRKGTTTAGAQVIVFMRTPVANTTSHVVTNFVAYFVNDTSSDIVTALVVTGIFSGSAATTWNRYGDSQDKSVIRIEEAGPSSAYVNGWPALT